MGGQENEMEESRNSYIKKFLMDKRTRCTWRGVGILRYYLITWPLLLFHDMVAFKACADSRMRINDKMI